MADFGLRDIRSLAMPTPSDCQHRSFQSVLRLVVVLILSVSAAPLFADKATDDFNLGVGFYRTQRWEQAAQTFDQFLKDFPQHERVALAHLYFGMSLSSLEKYAPARDHFDAYLKAEPEGRNSADARYRIGECSYYLRD